MRLFGCLLVSFAGWGGCLCDVLALIPVFASGWCGGFSILVCGFVVAFVGLALSCLLDFGCFLGFGVWCLVGFGLVGLVEYAFSWWAGCFGCLGSS